MSTVARILDAVAKHDPDAARVMAADAWWEEASAARRGFFDEAVPVLVHAWEAAGPRVAQRVGREYVVAKSVDADARFDPSGLLDEYQRTVEVLKATDSFRTRYGNIVTVNRDARGRFSRRSAGKVSDPGSWTLDAGRRRTVPESVTPYVEGVQTRRGRTRARLRDENAGDADTVRTYLGVVDEVQTLQDDLAAAVGRGSLKDYEIRVDFGSGRPVVLDADTDSYEWDAALGGAREYVVVPKRGLGTDEFNAANQKLAVFENLDSLGVAGRVDSETLDRLAGVLNESGNIDTPRSRRYASALKVGANLADAAGLSSVSRGMRGAAAATEEAERFRPALTRAAYRYRGTEKRPDPDLVAASAFQFGDSRGVGRLDAADRVTLELLGSSGDVLSSKLPVTEMVEDPVSRRKKPVKSFRTLEETALEAAGEKPGGKHGSLMPLVGRRVQHYQQSMFDRPATTEQLRLALQRDMVGQAFANRLMHSAARRGRATPEGREGRQGVIGTGERNMNRIIADIAQNIGRGLPSEGVLIDADGHPVAQSVGLGGDHYQPFTASALGKLNGGQYVRTRQHGGVTADDLRTLLMSNGRAAMVISGSGAFDIEFDPAFRDQRRMSDKALGMVETYERILDQLAGQQIYSRGLNTKQMAEIKQRAKMRYPDVRSQEFRDEVKSQVQAQLASETELSEQQELDAAAQGEQELRSRESNPGPALVRAAREEAVRRARDDKARALSLNAEGYEVALRTLQRYYPYFIRDVSYRPLSDLMSGSPFKEPDPSLSGAYGLAQSQQSDREYVRPGAARFGVDDNAWAGTPEPLTSPLNRYRPAAGGGGQQPAQQSAPAAAGGGVPAAQQSAETPAAGGGDRAAGQPEQAQRPASNVSPLMQQMQQTAVANRARLRDEAQKSFRSLLQADPIANDALQSGVSDLQSQIVAENVNLSPESIPVAWDDPRSKVTVARLASVGANREVFNELVNFVASRDEEEVGALREAVSSTDFGPDPQAAKTVHDALTSMIGHAEDVAYLTKPWEEPSDAPFNGNPKAFGFVSSVGLDNIGQVDSLPEVAAAVSALGGKYHVQDPPKLIADDLSVASRLVEQIKASPQAWGQAVSTSNDQAREWAVSQLVAQDLKAANMLDELSGGFDAKKLGDLVAGGGLERRVADMERVYAASHLVHQYQALANSKNRLEGGGVDPKEVARILGLNLVQKSRAGLPSRRSTVIKRLHRSHPAAVAVNSRMGRRRG